MVKFSENLIPKMTSNTAPSGVASASSISTNFDAWRAFDGDINTHWITNTGINTGWLSYKFTDKVSIGKYTINSPQGRPTRAPKDWTFEGSDDGINWTVLDTQVNQTNWVDGNKKEYLIATNNIYLHYRINVTANNGDALLSIAQLEVFEAIYEKNAILKNESTNKYYSLTEKTLIHLPSSTDKNMILHGIESGKEIKLDEYFDKMKYVRDTSEVLGEGKTFTHAVDMSNVKINKIMF